MGDDDVRVLSPANGETVASPFTLSYEAGADVGLVSLEANGQLVVEATAVKGDGGTMVVSLEEGRHAVALIGSDEQQVELSRHELTIRVAEEGSSWVTIVSPTDGAVVVNPVSFVVGASDDVDEVELLADDWSLGSVEPGGLLTYEFNGTGYARDIDAHGYADGQLVASDRISITVEEGSSPDPSSFNDYAVAILESYPTDGSHDYLWDGSYDGVTRDIWYLDELVGQSDGQGHCFCCGLTWELFMRSFEQIDLETGGAGSLNGQDVAEMFEFRTDWYVRDLWGSGPLEALENYGIGEEVTSLADLQPGDFVQFWRNSGSGHSVVFIDWETDGQGNINGLLYWSCQGSTDGVGYVSEYFGSDSSSIDPLYFFAARAWMPGDWLPW